MVSTYAVVVFTLPSARPDVVLSCSYDRCHDADMLLQILEEKGVPTEPLSDYINAFRYRMICTFHIHVSGQKCACKLVTRIIRHQYDMYDTIFLQLCSWSVEYRALLKAENESKSFPYPIAQQRVGVR